MNKKEALRILVEHSFTLNPQTKQAVLDSLERLDEKDIDAIGQALAKMKTESLASIDEDIRKIDAMLERGPQEILG